MLKLELSENMVAIIGKALGAQPFDLVSPIIVEIQKQISEQRKDDNVTMLRGNTNG